MNMHFNLGRLVILICLICHPCGAQEHLVFSRPENLSGIAALMGERVLKEAYGRLGIDFEFMELPNIRALSMANNGDTDGDFQRIAGLEQTYPNLIMISMPIGYVDIVVFTKNTEFKVEGWQSLAPYSIGFVRGFKLAEIHTAGMHVETVSSVEQAFLKLDTGRNDVVVDSRSALCRLKNCDVSGIRILDPPLDRHVVYHYLHKSHAALAAEVEAVLQRMEEEGELQILQEQAQQDFLKICGQ